MASVAKNSMGLVDYKVNLNIAVRLENLLMETKNSTFSSLRKQPTLRGRHLSPRKTFCEVSNGDLAKRRLFSQAKPLVAI